MFALNVVLSNSSLRFIKSELTYKLPGVKSSHRCEAIARGFGFKTYAAALTAIKMEPKLVLLQGDKFVSYLRSKNFEVSSAPFYSAGAKVALDEVAKAEINLTAWGMGIGRPHRQDDGRWETETSRLQRLAESRADLTAESAVRPFLASLVLSQNITKTKIIRPDAGSYYLKHIAENYTCSDPEGNKIGPVYVPNGIFIAAALHSGFRIKSFFDEYGYYRPNVTFNMSKPCIEDLDCRIRPNGARAQDRRRKEEVRQFRRGLFGFVGLPSL